MEASIAAVFNITNIAQCILELVSNSLNAGATAIAIRVHGENRKIQVIDNGKGILKQNLESLAEYDTQTFMNCYNVEDICNRRKQALANIRRLSDALLITSRYYNSSKTYIKVIKVSENPKVLESEKRPSQGTTVSIYGFHELALKKWDLTVVYNLVVNIAIANPYVSFSVRDDHRMEVPISIGKPHKPISIFKLLYNKEVQLHNIWYIKSIKNFEIKFCIFIGLANAKLTGTKNIFLNNKIVHSPLILQVVSTTFISILKFLRRELYEQMPKEDGIFVLLFIWSTDYIFTMENGKRTLILPRVQCLLENIKSRILKIFVQNSVPIAMSFSNRKHRSSMTPCTNNKDALKFYKRRLFAEQPSVLHRNCTIETLSCVTSREIIGTKVELQRKLGDNETILAKNNSLKLFTPASQSNDINKEIITLTLSEWSNWTLPDSKAHNSNALRCDTNASAFKDNNPQFYKRLDFLPEKLHKLLRGNNKLTNTDILNQYSGSVRSNELKLGLKIPEVLAHHEIDVRLCKVSQRFHEFTLKREHLKFTRILGQINNEVIVGLLVHNNRKMLLLMDQHALHERIRYEQLLDKYKSQIKNELFSIRLKAPIVIQLPTNSYNLLLSNKMKLRKFGITFNVLDNYTIMVTAVPECLKKFKYDYDEPKLKLNMHNLLNELLQSNTAYSSATSNLPSTIHNAIAMEACHGAIKFGDSLTLSQCKLLLKFVKETKAPTRCAHGRPSIIPLLELTDLEKRRRNIVQGKLNFGSLKLGRKKEM